MDIGIVYKGNSTLLLSIGQKGETNLDDFVCNLKGFKSSDNVIPVVSRMITDKNGSNNKFVARLSDTEINLFDLEGTNRIVVRIQRVTNNPVTQAYIRDVIFYFRLSDNNF